jgi:hypothetical protein
MSPYEITSRYRTPKQKKEEQCLSLAVRALYGVAALFLLLIALAGLYVHEARVVHSRREVIQWLHHHKGLAVARDEQSACPVWRQWLGDQVYDDLILDPSETLPQCFTFEYIRNTFPEAHVTSDPTRRAEYIAKP